MQLGNDDTFFWGGGKTVANVSRAFTAPARAAALLPLSNQSSRFVSLTLDWLERKPRLL